MDSLLAAVLTAEASASLIFATAVVTTPPPA
jgi:hypothetical protein